MRGEGEERDYLAGTQLETDPNSFAEVLKEAFHLEHGVTQNQDIAAILGVNKSRVSQILGDPRDLKASTIRNLLTKLTRPALRRRVLNAWIRTAIGDVAKGPGATRLIGEPGPQTIRRIDRMVRQSRLSFAVLLAAEAAREAKDMAVREMALDRLVFLRQRLDEPGRAMEAAREIVLGARGRKEPRREAAGHLYRFRILVGLADTKPGEVDPILDVAEALIAGAKPPEDAPPYLIGRESTLSAYRLNSRLLFMERGVLPLDHAMLGEVMEAARRVASGKHPFQKKHQGFQTIARIHLLLGETSAAAEAIDRAFEAGEVKNLHAYETSGLLMGMVQRLTEKPETAGEYLSRVAANCRKEEDRYHQRLAEWELARLLDSMF